MAGGEGSLSSLVRETIMCRPTQVMLALLE